MSNNQSHRPDVAKVIFLSSAAVIALGAAFAAGLYSAHSRNVAWRLAQGAYQNVALVFQESENIVPDGEPIHFLQPIRNEGDGVTVNETTDDALVMLASFFDGGNEIRLIERDGTVVARWPARFSEHFPNPEHLRWPPATDRNVDLHGAVMNPDGSVVFNYEYAGSVKLSRCGDVLWTVAHPTHHSVDRAEGGGYWIPGRGYVDAGDPPGAFPPLTTVTDEGEFIDDLILKVSEDGEIVERASVTRAIYDSGLEAVLTATGYSFTDDGHAEYEIVHVNKIAELPSAIADAFPLFEAGDIAVSMRRYNLIVVIDPDTWRVKWHQVGPWLRQHDPEFLPDGRIGVFNNNTYVMTLLPGDQVDVEVPLVSTLIAIDPETRETEVVAGAPEGEAFMTVIRGKHDPVPDGGWLITEFEGGRAVEVDAEGQVVWEFVNRYDETRVAEVTEARRYPADYFTVEDWSCPEPE